MPSQFQSISTMQFAICSAKWLVRIQEQLVPVFFVSVISQVASSHPRTACACQFILVIGQVTSSNPRTACTRAFLFLLSAKQLVRVQEQLVPVNLLLLSAKRLVQIQEQLVPIYLSVFSVKFPVRAKRTTCTYQFAVCFPSEPCYLLSC